MPALTLIEKLATKHAVGLKPEQPARSGDIITIRPKHVMTHDNTSAVMSKFKEIFKAEGSPSLVAGCVPRIHNPRQPVFAIDHDIQNISPDNLGKYAKIEAFAREHSIDFYPAGTGISHQVMVEQGYVTPGSMVVGSDSHSNLYGAACCLGTPVVRTDAASIWATGVTWWQVPPVARCVLKGKLQPGVVGKDVIIALCGLFNHDEVLNMAVEFVGDDAALRCLTMDQRMSIANMTTEWGALVGIFPLDEMLRDYLYGRAAYLAKKSETRLTRAMVDQWWAARDELKADPGAHYAVELELDLSTVTPHVSGPDDVKTMTALPEIEKRRVKIDRAYLLSCVNARLEDLREAASVVNGHTVAPGVEFYLAAASAEVQKQAEAEGTWQTLIGCGAIPLPSGCGPCIGLGIGTLKAGEVGISATNRNFKGRMGDRDAHAYLGSPAVVAASAIAGYICAPGMARFTEDRPRYSVKVNDSAARQSSRGVSEIIEGFPSKVRGRALWLPIDNLNTDGIYSGKLTYRDDVTPEEMARACFNNYDPQFVSIARPGDIVISGRNFGTGSSREQAATCLQHFGIPCVVAFSFSETYKRNAFNNGFVVFECPALVEYLEARSPCPPGRGVGGEGDDRAAARPTQRPPVDPELLQFARNLRQKQTDDSPLTPLPEGEGGKRLTIPVGDIEVDYQHSTVRFDSREFPFPPLSPTAQELIVAGGAEKLVTRRLAMQH